MKAPLQLLLDRLQAARITLAEKREDPETGTITYIFTAPAPAFPHGAGRSNLWYPLALPLGAVMVDKRQVDALLRRLWHLESEPIKPHEWISDQPPGTVIGPAGVA